MTLMLFSRFLLSSPPCVTLVLYCIKVRLGVQDNTTWENLHNHFSKTWATTYYISHCHILSMPYINIFYSPPFCASGDAKSQLLKLEWWWCPLYIFYVEWKEAPVTSANVLKLIHQGRFLHGSVSIGGICIYNLCYDHSPNNIFLHKFEIFIQTVK